MEEGNWTIGSNGGSGEYWDGRIDRLESFKEQLMIRTF